MTDFQLSISLSRPFGTQFRLYLCHGTAPSACTVLFISHPFRVIIRSHHTLSRPFGTHSRLSLCHGTAPSACNVFFISHPFRVINSCPLFIVAALLDAFPVIFVSRHCTFGLYRVIHISPFQGDYLKSPYIVAALRDAVPVVFVPQHCAFGLYRVIHISPFQGD